MTLLQQFSSVTWCSGPTGPIVRLIDQTRLPAQTVYLDCAEPEQLRRAICDLVVRGAPAIGVAAAYGIAQELTLVCAADAKADFDSALAQSCQAFAGTRPTAVNLFWAIDRMRAVGMRTAGRPAAERVAALESEAVAIHRDDIACCLAIGAHGAPLMPERGSVLTHCNTGGLATGGHGTALGVIRSAIAAGKQLHVWVDETRPLLQGARLTAWECVQDGIPATLITDNMAGHVMKLGLVQAAIVGADRIALNGDSANKIGTYAVAVLCAYHGIPFYVAAPTSTIDLECPNGDAIPIEERKPTEVTEPQGVRFAPPDIAVFNPAFDVAPGQLIAGIITEEGVARPPFTADLQAMVARAKQRLDQSAASAASPL